MVEARSSDASCPSCGADLLAGDRFCANCGSTVQLRLSACPTCSTELQPGDAFCTECGSRVDVPTPAAPPEGIREAPRYVAPEGGLPCPNCGTRIAARTGFCRRCGASLTGELPPRPDRVRFLAIFAASGVALLAIAIIVFFATRDGDNTQPAGGDASNNGTDIFTSLETQPLSEEAKATFALAADELPEPQGHTEAEMLHSLLGPPDYFLLEFEDPDDGGPRQRFETWYYLELGISYDFLDGVLLYAFPTQEPPPLVLVPLRYDPLDFTAETSLDDIRDMMFNPDSLVEERPPEEYLTPYPVWMGEQLVAQFDGDGALFLVETVPLGPEE